MNIINTKIKDLVIIEPSVFEDNRGYFMESSKTHGLQNFPSINFIRKMNLNLLKVYTGLTFQNPPFDQTKLVRVINGKVQM